MSSSTTDTVMVFWPPQVPEGYEENFHQLEILPVPRTGYLKGKFSVYGSSIPAVPSIRQVGTLADIHNLGRAISSYLYYTDQHLVALRVLYLRPQVPINDPLNLAFESFTSAYTASFTKYRNALSSNLTNLLSSISIPPVFQQSGKDKNTGETIAIELSSLLQLQTKVKSQFKTPFDNSHDVDTVAVGNTQGQAGAKVTSKNPVPQVFFTTATTPHWLLPHDSVKIPIISPSTHTTFWTHLKATIPTLLATLPRQACIHRDYSATINPNNNSSSYPQDDSTINTATTITTTTTTTTQQQSLANHFRAAQDEGDTFFSILHDELNYLVKQKKAERKKQAKAAKKNKKRGGLPHEDAQLRSVLAADCVIRDHPITVGMDDQMEDDDDDDDEGEEEERRERQKKKKGKKGKARNRVRFQQDVKIIQGDDVVMIRMEG